MRTEDRYSYSYDQLFYEYQRKGSARSAQQVLPSVAKLLMVDSVLDVGCGAGAWLAEWGRLGVKDVTGVDGEYVDRSMLLLDAKKFDPRDISKPFDLERQYDLVQCLEVGEHVPREASGVLVDNLVRHGKRILFSAAVPGQGGENHVNERPYEFWRDLFRQRGYRLFDFVRPMIQDSAEVEPWYRYNVLFFAHDEVVAGLPSAVAEHRVEDRAPVKDFSPLSYRLQKALLRLLPSVVVTAIAEVRHKWVVRSIKQESKVR